MQPRFHYLFEWDPSKASTNARKQSVTFVEAATVFRDPFALSTYDEEHGEQEERWVTLGQAEDGRLLVVVHTYRDISETEALVRVVSARIANNRERQDYEAS